MTLEELAARLADVERRLDLVTQRLLHGTPGQPAAPGWRPEWAPPKRLRPLCGAKTRTGKACAARVEWDREHQAPLHGRCAKHAPAADLRALVREMAPERKDNP